MGTRFEVAPLTANEARKLTHRVKDHRKNVADRMLVNIYKSIHARARYGDRAICYSCPSVTHTVFDIQAVIQVVLDALRLRNYRVANVGHVIYISWA